MPDEPQHSPRMSFKGWLFSVWLTKNKGFIKNVLSPLSAIAAGGAILDVATLRYVGIVLGFAVLTIAFKLGWDAVDYFFMENPS